jgi:hypothetical protein
MPERVQPGATIPKSLWAKFREDVKRRRGKVRGVLGDELETALRNHLDEQDRRVEASDIQRLDARLQRIEDAVETAHADGGGTVSTESTHAHATVEPATERPAPNADTGRKRRWLAEQILHKYGTADGDLPDELPKAAIRDTIKTEYGFRSDTAKRYYEELVDHLGLVQHPTAGPLLVTPDHYETLTTTDQ